MKRIKVEARIGQMQSITGAEAIAKWLDELEERDAKVRVVVEEIESSEGILVETE